MFNSSTTIEIAIDTRLNDFICYHINKTNIATVAENYIPLREQYYAVKQENTQRKENLNV